MKITTAKKSIASLGAAVLVATVVVVGKYRAATLEKAGNFGGLEGFSLD